MKIIVAVSSLFAIFGSFAATADGSCRAVDLRRPDLNRPQSQIFISADGTETDSAMCASFSSALLISQVLGISVSPVDYAFQSSLPKILEAIKQFHQLGVPTSEDISEINSALQSNKKIGFCSQEAVDAYFGKKQNYFIQAFNDSVHQINSSKSASDFEQMLVSELQKLGQWLNDICSKRIQSPPHEFLTIETKAANYVPNQPGYTLMSKSGVGGEIDRLLNAGHFVSYVHAFHAVTIVGRTEDCRYIIQDSIPESAWTNIFGGLKASLSGQEDQDQITFENQHFQYWPRSILLKNLVKIRYIAPQIR